MRPTNYVLAGLLVLFSSAISTLLGAEGGSGTTDGPFLLSRILHFSTAGYRGEALRVLTAEVNRVSARMHLLDGEPTPMTGDSIKESFISPPMSAATFGWFGSLKGTVFEYSANQDCRLCSIERIGRDSSEFLSSVRARYGTTSDRMNTNSAISLAVNWLRAAGCDVDAMTQETVVEATASRHEGSYVPLFWVSWLQAPSSGCETAGDERRGGRAAAEVWLLEPEKKLLQLNLFCPKYVRNPRLEVASAYALLTQTDDPVMRQAFETSPAYENAALAALLRDINAVGPKLGLKQTWPLRPESLVQKTVGTRFMSSHAGFFGSLATANYRYSAGYGSKLCWIEKNRSDFEERRFLTSLLATGRPGPSLAYSNAVYTAAARYLDIFGVNVPRMEHSFHPIVEPLLLGSCTTRVFEARWVGQRNSVVAATVTVSEPDYDLQRIVVPQAQFLERPPLVVRP